MATIKVMLGHQPSQQQQQQQQPSCMNYHLDTSIFKITIYPPTPAICRGSAPEKKWLCGALRPSSMSLAAFLEIFFWLQKATLGTRLALNASRRPRLPLNPSRRPSAQQHVLWPPAGRFPSDFLLVSESNVRH